MRLAVFASGGGSNFQSIVDAVESGTLRAEVGLCVSNRTSAGVLARAAEHGIPAVVIDPADFAEQDYARLLMGKLEEARIDFIALAGYLRQIPPEIVDRFRERTVNIHPALLPSFGGKGMYGHHVHDAVLASGTAFSGATVHFVDSEYDTGPIILQDTVPVSLEDTPLSLAERVLAVEHRLYPAALSLIQQGRVHIDGRRVHVTDPLHTRP
jgi:formyltetrahydrofolate-dependent phosphoribosylglycinamide formyltransferase